MQREESLAKREWQLERLAEEWTNEDEIEEEEESFKKKRLVRANQVKTKKKKIEEDEEIPVVAVKFIEYDLNNRNHKINGEIEPVPLNKIIGFNTDVFKKDVI